MGETREEKIGRVVRAARILRDTTRFVPAEHPETEEDWDRLDEALNGLDDHTAQSLIDPDEGVQKL